MEKRNLRRVSLCLPLDGFPTRFSFREGMNAEHARDVTYLSVLHRYTRRSITAPFDAPVIDGRRWFSTEVARNRVDTISYRERERVALANFLITFLHPLSGSSPRQYYLKLPRKRRLCRGDFAVAKTSHPLMRTIARRGERLNLRGGGIVLS